MPPKRDGRAARVSFGRARRPCHLRSGAGYVGGAGFGKGCDGTARGVPPTAALARRRRRPMSTSCTTRNFGTSRRAALKKLDVLRLHIAGHEVELLGPNLPGPDRRVIAENRAMRRVFVLTMVASLTASAAGCHHKNWLRNCCNPCAPRCEPECAPRRCEPCEGVEMSGPFADPRMSGPYFEEGGPYPGPVGGAGGAYAAPTGPYFEEGPSGPGPGPGPAVEYVSPGPG